MRFRRRVRSFSSTELDGPVKSHKQSRRDAGMTGRGMHLEVAGHGQGTRLIPIRFRHRSFTLTCYRVFSAAQRVARRILSPKARRRTK